MENDDNDVQNMSFDSIKSVQSNLISKISIISFKDNLKNILLVLTNYKLNNKADNEIICFFNKCSNRIPNNIYIGHIKIQIFYYDQ